MTPDEKFRAAVNRWIANKYYSGATAEISDVSIELTTQWYSTLTGGDESIQLQWMANGQLRSEEINPSDLGRWIGELL